MSGQNCKFVKTYYNMIKEQPFYYFQSGDTIVSQPDSLLKADTLKSDTVVSKSIVGTADTIQPVVKTDSVALTEEKDSMNQSVVEVVASDTTGKQEVQGNKVSKKVIPQETASSEVKQKTLQKSSVKTDTTVLQDSAFVFASGDSANVVTKKSDDSANIFLQGTTSLPDPIVRKSSSPLQKYNDWLSGFLIFSVVIIGFLRISSMKFLRELFSSAFYSQAANKMYSSVNIRNSKPSFILSVLFFINTGIFIFEALVFYGETIFGQEGFSLLIIVWVILIVYDVIKGLLYRITGFVFETSFLTGEYLFNASMLSKVFAILLLPIISVIPFVNIWIVPNLIKLGVGMFIVLYIWQLFRGMKIFFQNTFSVFYMFLYFCALEILPLVILYKILFS